MTTHIIRRTYTPVTNEALSLRDMRSRLMENAFVSPEQWIADWQQYPSMEVAPPIDVIETNEGYSLKAALPGWKPENVDITFEGGTITLKGEVAVQGNEGGDKTRWHRHEIRQSSFARSITLPSEVEADKAKAVFENGILELTLPKAEVIRPMQIKITAK